MLSVQDAHDLRRLLLLFEEECCDGPEFTQDKLRVTAVLDTCDIIIHGWPDTGENRAGLADRC